MCRGDFERSGQNRSKSDKLQERDVKHKDEDKKRLPWSEHADLTKGGVIGNALEATLYRVKRGQHWKGVRGREKTYAQRGGEIGWAKKASVCLGLENTGEVEGRKKKKKGMKEKNRGISQTHF